MEGRGHDLLRQILIASLNDLVRARIGDGKHGFTYPVPATMKDNKPHSILVRIATTNIALQDGPKTITCAPA